MRSARPAPRCCCGTATAANRCGCSCPARRGTSLNQPARSPRCRAPAPARSPDARPLRLPSGQPEEHNDAVTYGQVGAVCPQCGSAAAVHSVEELAAMARTQLGEYPPGFPAAPWPEPPPGYPPPPPPGYTGPPPPGYTGEARPSPRSSSSGEGSGSGFDTSFGDEVADVVLTAATRFIGRAIGRRVKRTYERVQPTLAAKQEAMLREQIAIAERHPDLRACLTDQVIFLASGSRVLPMAGVIGR